MLQSIPKNTHFPHFALYQILRGVKIFYQYIQDYILICVYDMHVQVRACRSTHVELREQPQGLSSAMGSLVFFHSTACAKLACLQASRAPSCLHLPCSCRNAGITGTHTTTPICTWVLGFKLKFTLARQALHSLSCFPSSPTTP